MYKLSKDLSVLGTISPQKINGTTAASGYINMNARHKVLFAITVGQCDATVDAKIEQSTSSSGAGKKDLAGKSVTQYTASDDDKIALIEVDSSELDLANGYTHLDCLITVGSGATIGANIAMLAFGGFTRHHAASDGNLAAVKETVN